MQIPRSFYGSYKQVSLHCRKVARKVANGADWQEAVDSEETINASDNPGLIVLSGPNPMINAYGSNFHCYVLWDEIRKASATDAWLRPKHYKKAIDIEIQNEIFNTSLKSDWGILGLLADKNFVWFAHYPRLYSLEQWSVMRYQPMLRACLSSWDLFAAQGKRYSNGSTPGEDIWSLPTSLRYILANMGLPVEDLNRPLPQEGLIALVSRLQIKL